MNGSQLSTRRRLRQYNQKVLRAVCLVGFATALAMATYIVLTLTPIGHHLSIGRVRLPDISVNVLFAIAFILVGIVELMSTYRKHTSVTLLLSLHYFSLMVFNILVSGNREFTDILWLILLTATGLTAGWRFMLGGGITMLATLILAQFWLGSTPLMIAILGDVITSTLTLAVAMSVVWLRQIDMVQADAYEKLKVREQLNEQRLETIINSITDAVLSVGRGGKINFYNAATLSLVDTNKSLGGQFLDEFFHLVDSNNKPIKFANILLQISRTTTRDDLCHVYADGQKINLMIEISPVREVFQGSSVSTDAGLILVLRDITKQKSLDDQRDEFISVVSHELRTPVAIAEGALSNLQFLLAKNADPKTFGANIDSAHDEIIYLSKMVNDLSTLSRAQRGVMMDPEAIDVREFTDSLYQK
jgi:PAS domain-containing protein